MRLQDKVTLITGASSGIGRATSLLFAREGAAVVAVDIDDDRGHETVRMINDAGGQAIFVHADVSQAIDCRNMVQAAEETYGRLNILFNNAGIMHGRDDDAINTDEDIWDIGAIAAFFALSNRINRACLMRIKPNLFSIKIILNIGWERILEFTIACLFWQDHFNVFNLFFVRFQIFYVTDEIL